jgi:hypothetical protein
MSSAAAMGAMDIIARATQVITFLIPNIDPPEISLLTTPVD